MMLSSSITRCTLRRTMRSATSTSNTSSVVGGAIRHFASTEQKQLEQSGVTTVPKQNHDDDANTSIEARISSSSSSSSSSPPHPPQLALLGSIYNPPPYPIEPEEIANSIRCSLVGASMSHAEASRDTGMSLVFLGTGAGLPTKGRCPTSTLLKLGGESFLVDVGEGVQRQLTFTRAKPSHIDRIFITHLHGDHIFGLPGLLLGLQHSQQYHQHQDIATSNTSRHTNTDPEEESSYHKPGIPKKSVVRRQRGRRGLESEERVVKIYGPPGLYNYIASNIILSCTLIHSLNIQVYELVGGRVRRAHGARDIRNPFETNYPEFNFGRLTRHQIPCNPDGVWIIQDLPPMVTREDILSKTSSFSNRHRSSSSNDNDTDSTDSTNTTTSRKINNNDRRFRIQAAEVDHLSGVATFGYTIQEEEPPRNIDAAQAKELGVSPIGHKYNLLKAGFSVLTDDGSQEVRPEQVLTARRKKARKVTFVGDNRGWTPSMKRIARDSDVLVHEATLMDKDSDWGKRGHSTAEMAGKISGEVNAKVLLLNHISPKADYLDQEDGHSAQLSLIQDAKDASNDISKVVVTYDFMELLVPWLGFGSRPEDAVESGAPTITRASKSALNTSEQPVDAKQVLKDWFGPNS